MRAYLSFLSLLIASVALAQPTSPPVGPANCATSPTLLCLAGRVGSANDLILSTTTGGAIYGSTGVNDSLSLYATNNGGPSAATAVYLNANNIELLPLSTSTSPKLTLWENDTANFNSFQTDPSQSTNVDYMLPSAAPASNGYKLAGTTAGALSWDDPADDANCSATTLTCRAGRSGTGNDTIISSDDNGTLTGSGGASTKILALRGSSATTRTAAGNEVTFGDQVTSLSTNAGAYNTIEWTAAPSWDTNASIVNVFSTGEHRAWTINAGQGGTGGVRGFAYTPVVKAGADFDNSPAVDDMGSYVGHLFAPVFESTSAKKAYVDFVTGIFDGGNLCATETFPCDHGTGDAATVGQWVGHWFNPAPDTNATFTKAIGFYNNINNNRGTLTELNGIEDQPTIGSGRTLPDRRGLYFRAHSGSGTQTNAIAVDVIDQTVGTLAAGMRSTMTASGTSKFHLDLTGDAPSLFGGPIVGSTAADGGLTLNSTLNSDMGTITIGGTPSTDNPEIAMTWAPSFSSAASQIVEYQLFNPAITNTSTVGTSTKAFYCSGTVTHTTAGSPFPVSQQSCMIADWVLSATGSSAMPLGQVMLDTTTFKSEGATTAGPQRSIYINQTFQTDATGTIAGTTTTAYPIDLNMKIDAGTADTQTITTLSDIHIANIAASGAGTTAVGTQSGLHVDALTKGTNNMQIRLVEGSTIGTVPASSVGIYAVSGAPNRLAAVNENQMRFDAGGTTWTGSTASALASGTGTSYFSANGRVAPDATEGNVDEAVPGAMTVTYMACGLAVDPDSGGGTQTRTFTFMDDTATTAAACTISEGSRKCTWCQTGTTGCDATGSAVSVALGSMVDIRATGAGGGGPAASDASCTLWWTLDAF